MAQAGKSMKSNWIQGARARMKKKGTVGSFTRWCKNQGFPGVTEACILKAKKSGSPAIRKKAAFASAMRSIRRKKK